jgi:ethanolamine utilization cobalamin adenosyltransferase
MIKKRTICGVEHTIEITESALKHSKTVNDILSVLENIIYDEMIDDDPEKTLSVGFDANAGLTELISHEVTEYHLVVFHAMPCRKEYVGNIMRR